jgi:cytochrome c5
MKLFKLIFLSLVLLTLYYSCYYDNEELLYPQVSSNCDTTNVTYKSSVSTILGNYCYSCHSNSVASSYGGNIKLQDYADVKSNINRVYGAIMHQNGYSAMPKGGSKLSDCSIQTIKIWMDAGSPNN